MASSEEKATRKRPRPKFRTTKKSTAMPPTVSKNPNSTTGIKIAHTRRKTTSAGTWLETSRFIFSSPWNDRAHSPGRRAASRTRSNKESTSTKGNWVRENQARTGVPNWLESRPTGRLFSRRNGKRCMRQSTQLSERTYLRRRRNSGDRQAESVGVAVGRVIGRFGRRLAGLCVAGLCRKRRGRRQAR